MSQIDPTQPIYVAECPCYSFPLTTGQNLEQLIQRAHSQEMWHRKNNNPNCTVHITKYTLQREGEVDRTHRILEVHA